MTIRAIFATFLLLASSVTIAKHNVEMHYPGYESLEEAAAHAVEAAYELTGNDAESASVLYQNNSNHKYYYAVPNTNGHVDFVIAYRNVPVEGYTIVGDVHTHPCVSDGYSQYFSDTDLQGITRVGNVGFIGDMCNGNIHEFDPKKDKVNVVVEGISISEGRIVGHFTVSHPQPDYLPNPKDIVPIIETPTEVVSQVQMLNPTFEEVDKAAIAGLLNAYQQEGSDKWEYGGIIFLHLADAKYYITHPITSKNVAFLTLSSLLTGTSGYIPVASFHTHVCKKNLSHEYFSITDVASAKTSNLRSYIADLCDGNVHRYVPNIDNTKIRFSKHNNDEVVGYGAEGHIVGWIGILPHDPKN